MHTFWNVIKKIRTFWSVMIEVSKMSTTKWLILSHAIKQLYIFWNVINESNIFTYHQKRVRQNVHYRLKTRAFRIILRRGQKVFTPSKCTKAWLWIQASFDSIYKIIFFYFLYSAFPLFLTDQSAVISLPLVNHHNHVASLRRAPMKAWPPIST